MTATPAKSAAPDAAAATLKPAEPRKSQDQGSTAGSDASYDIVSGATTGAAGSPREDDKGKTGEGKTGEGKKDESDEEDWE